MIKTFEQYNNLDPYGEEEWDNNEIVIPKDEIDGTYYFINDTVAYIEGFPIPSSSIEKIKLEYLKPKEWRCAQCRRTNPPENESCYKCQYVPDWPREHVKYTFRNYSGNVPYDQFLNDLISTYPKGKSYNDSTYYLFREQDWESDRMKRIFNRVFSKIEKYYVNPIYWEKIGKPQPPLYKHLDFDDVKDEVNKVLDEKGYIHSSTINSICRKIYNNEDWKNN